MKITTTPFGPTATPGTRVDSPAARAYGASSLPRSTGSAQVELSPAAQQLLALQDGDNDIDMARVQEIRDAIAAGQLKIDASRIADSLIASAQELLK